MATIEVVTSSVRPGFAFMAIDHKINWRTCDDWKCSTEQRGKERWEWHQVWIEQVSR